MNKFQKEIETYNELTFARESIWLTRVEKRENKTHISVKISLKFKNDADKAIKKELIVNEKTLQVTKFLNNRIKQCHKCQEFEHLINTYRETNAKCRLCAKNHDIRMHICLICKSTKLCSHISSKCANCDESHAANDSNCEHFRAIEIKSRKNNQFATLWVTQLFKKLKSCNIIVQNLQTHWSINDDAEIDSNYEIIEFSINIENIETIDDSMTKQFNTQKANWNKFSEYFKNNHSSIKSRMSILLNNLCQKNLNEDAKLLRNVIIETSNRFISKRRSCGNSKVWWTNKLTQLKKNLAKAKRMYKVLSTEENLSIFKRNRNDYFQTIRSAKKEFWSNFLNNAIEKKIFQAYKFIKNNWMKKLSSIKYEKKTNIEFENKCNAFIKAMYSTSLNVENTSDETKIRLKLNSNSFEWSNLIESELRKAIFIFVSNKASRLDQLIFLIVQKTYNSISNIFSMLYSELINRDHHLLC